jgi:M6 family metalloprotease-like protein
LPTRSALVVVAVAILVALPSRVRGQALPQPRREIPGLDFHRDGVWRKRARQVAARRAGMLARGQFGALNAPLAARVAAPNAAAVSGVLFVPAILFKYADTPGATPLDTAAYNAVLFAATPPPGRPYTLRSFYQQLSNGLLDIQGRTYGYAALDSLEVTYAGPPPCAGNPYTGTDNCNGLFDFSGGQSGPDPVTRMQSGLTEALQKLDASIDWTQYDSDGDGYVDLVVFLPPARDGACGGSANNHLWAHRFFLFSPFTTHSPGPGGALKVRDYILQSGVGGSSSCDSTDIMPIGTVAHETGHGFGLPDLYDTSPFESSEGIGDWGLMGSGNYTSALSPSRMEAWSLNELGWVTIAPLSAAGTYSFGAAAVSDTAFYVTVPGANPRGEYFLLENRQGSQSNPGSQSDSAMTRIHCTRSGSPPGCAGGVLVWHVDPQQIAYGNPSNEVNVGAIHGVALVQADGRNDLDAGTNRGDAGDLYPGVTGKTALSPANNVDGRFAGFMIDLIQQAVPGGAMSFRLLFGAPALSTQAVVAQLLTGSGLTAAEQSYLDMNGNRNAQFDLGDFLAWVNATGAP